MAIMGKIFEFLGFENGEKSEKRKVKNDKQVKASYNFKKKQKVEKIDNIDGIAVVYPEIELDGKKYLSNIKNREPLIISIEFCQKDEISGLLSYLTGAIEIERGKLVELEKDKYFILLPEDMEIEN